jgi:hypothetical protein
MSVTVKQTQVRATPSYLGKILGLLSYGDKVTVLDQPEEMVILATAAKEEVEEVPVVEAEVAAEGAAEPEVIEKGKKEEEEEEGKAEKK